MASIRKIGDGKWRARYRTPDGASRSKSFARRVDAEQLLVSVEHSKHDGSYVDRAAGRVTFGEYAQRWQGLQVQHRPTSAARVEANLRLHLVPAFGPRPIAAITTGEVRGWVKVMADALSPNSVLSVYRCLAAIFGAAAEDRVIARTPCVNIKLPRVERRLIEPLTVEKVAALTAALPERYRALVTLSAGTGMRQGECLGLTVDRVDFLRRVVRVDRQLVRSTGAPVFGPPKTAASVRTIPLPQVVVDALAAHLAAFPAGSDGFVFTTDRGAPINRSAFSHVWLSAARKTGLADDESFHSLRHFYASLLIRHGESVKVVQSRLGHASASETLDTYSHLWPDSEDRTRSAIDDVLGSPAPARVTLVAQPPS